MAKACSALSLSKMSPNWHHAHRKILHVADAVKSGYVRIVDRSVDTDVLILAVALVQKLQEQTQESIQLWVAFGTGTNRCYVSSS